jgi:two-component system phosphate regulon sensor histidine kinase PhoR
MKGRGILASLVAGAIAAIGVAGALFLGAPLVAALLALLAGALASARMRPFDLAPAALEAPKVATPIESEERPPSSPGLADLIGTVDEPMLVVRDRRVTAANRAAKGLLGDHIEETDVRLALRHPTAAALLTAPPAQDGSEPVRTELVGLGGTDRHWAMTVVGLADGSRLVRLVDLSQARAAEQMRADFVANASHELRTPLATLLGFLETLQDEAAAGDPATRDRFLRIMFDEAMRMRSLVDDLISLSRIEAERFAAPSDLVDLRGVIEAVRESLSALADTRRSEIIVENVANDTVVAGDRAQLGQLVRNLVANALNYGRAGAPVRIRIEEAGGGMLRVRVIDQGEGIAAEHIPRLTERFYRVDTGRSRSVGGTGLGLAIAKHIALRHRGRLEIVSKLGEGTSVRVYLPHASTSPATSVTKPSHN